MTLILLPSKKRMVNHAVTSFQLDTQQGHGESLEDEKFGSGPSAVQDPVTIQSYGAPLLNWIVSH